MCVHKMLMYVYTTVVFQWQLAFAGAEKGVQFFYSFVFCATSATIFAGAVAERTHLLAYLFFK